MKKSLVDYVYESETEQQINGCMIIFLVIAAIYITIQYFAL